MWNGNELVEMAGNEVEIGAFRLIATNARRALSISSRRNPPAEIAASRAWFNSEQFELCARSLGIKPVSLRKKILSKEGVEWRGKDIRRQEENFFGR